MEADAPALRSSDSLAMLECSSEARQYLEMLLEHEETEACLYSGCMECRMLAKICALIQAEIFKVDEHPVSISEQESTDADAITDPGLRALQVGRDGI
jgi:hypothetical protein